MKRKFLLLLATTLLSLSQASAQTDEGVFVRLLDVRVDPQTVENWESGVKAIAEGARSVGDEFCCDWLLYRQGLSRYRIVFFSDGFGDLQTPDSFAGLFDGTAGETAFLRGVEIIQGSKYEVTADVVHQMVNGWSTVEGMSTSTHPKGRLTMYWVRPGSESEFDVAMRDYASLLKEVSYPYPVEGFQWRLGSPGVNYSALFPDKWESFFGENAPRAYLDRQGRLADYDAIQARIFAAVYRVEQHDIDFDVELSF